MVDPARGQHETLDGRWHRGGPGWLTSREVIVNLIANTTTTKGLKVQCQLDPAEYPAGIAVSDDELKEVQIERDQFHPDWNYDVHPAADDDDEALATPITPTPPKKRK